MRVFQFAPVARRLVLCMFSLLLVLLFAPSSPVHSPQPRAYMQTPAGGVDGTSASTVRPDNEQRMTSLQTRSSTRLADLPQAAQSLVSATLGRDNATYHFQASAEGYQIAPPSQTWRADFSNAGVRLESGGAHWKLALQGIGYGDALEAVSAVAPTVSANRLEYVRGAMTEWYVNGPAGLEQGWTLTAPPTSSASMPEGEGHVLTLALALEGAARLDPSGRAVDLLRDDGATALRYTGLAAYDATGRELRAWLDQSTQGDARLRIRVDDTRAQYPLTIDPYVLQATLTKAAGSAPYDYLGWSVAISSDGSTVVAGAWQANGDKGAVYVFSRAGANWATPGAPTAILTNSASVANNELGISVAITSDGSTIVAGADGVSSNRGAVYVFVRPGSAWATTATPSAVLTNSTGAANDRLGFTVALSSDGASIAAGAYGVNSGVGAVYVFARSGSNWATTSSPAATLTVAGGATTDNLGESSAISSDGSTIVAGVRSTNGNKGAAYVFVRPGASWTTTSSPTATLTNSGGAAGDHLASSVAVSSNGSTVAAGAAGVGSSKGAVYVFGKPGGGWASTGTPSAVLTNSGGSPNDGLGGAVAMSPDASTITAGAAGRGAAYVFLRPGSTWTATGTPTATLTNSSGTLNDYLGWSVAISSDASSVVVGAWGANSERGEAHVYVKPGGGWASTGTPNATLVNMGGAAGDSLGGSVAISGDGSTLVAAATGFNGGRGALYVFVKSGDSWATTASPNATLTNAASAAGDHFGGSVAINGDGSIVVAGSYGVSGGKGAVDVFAKPGSGWVTTGTPTAILTNASGVADDWLGGSVGISSDGATIVAGGYGVSSRKGAAYVFARSGSTWTTTSSPSATLTNASGAASDEFGISVGISADGLTIVAGADSANAVYVFAKPGSSWATTGSPTATLSNSSGSFGDWLGYTVAIDSNGSTIVAGANGVSGYRGAAYVFVRPGSTWVSTSNPTAALTNSAGAALDYLSLPVAISGDGSTILAGASGVNSAYAFIRPNAGWVTTGSPDVTLAGTGSRVAINSDSSTLVGGAPGASSGKGAVNVFYQPVATTHLIYLPFMVR